VVGLAWVTVGSSVAAAEGLGLGVSASRLGLSLRAATTDAVICLSSSSLAGAAMKELVVMLGVVDTGGAVGKNKQNLHLLGGGGCVLRNYLER
jgi:hypothetical protein